MIATAQTHRTQRNHRDPSPQEVARMCAEIRRGWTKAERRQRATMAKLYQACLLDATTQSAA